jgi:hypothetical protein
MTYAWVLTVLFMTGAYSDNTTSQQYNFKTREECVKAQSFYSKLKFRPEGYSSYKAKVIGSSCYPSYVTK